MKNLLLILFSFSFSLAYSQTIGNDSTFVYNGIIRLDGNFSIDSVHQDSQFINYTVLYAEEDNVYVKNITLLKVCKNHFTKGGLVYRSEFTKWLDDVSNCYYLYPIPKKMDTYNLDSGYFLNYLKNE